MGHVWVMLDFIGFCGRLLGAFHLIFIINSIYTYNYKILQGAMIRINGSPKGKLLYVFFPYVKYFGANFKKLHSFPVLIISVLNVI